MKKQKSIVAFLVLICIMTATATLATSTPQFNSIEELNDYYANGSQQQNYFTWEEYNSGASQVNDYYFYEYFEGQEYYSEEAYDAAFDEYEEDIREYYYGELDDDPDPQILREIFDDSDDMNDVYQRIDDLKFERDAATRKKLPPTLWPQDQSLTNQEMNSDTIDTAQTPESKETPIAQIIFIILFGAGIVWLVYKNHSS